MGFITLIIELPFYLLINFTIRSRIKERNTPKDIHKKPAKRNVDRDGMSIQKNPLFRDIWEKDYNKEFDDALAAVAKKDKEHGKQM